MPMPWGAALLSAHCTALPQTEGQVWRQRGGEAGWGCAATAGCYSCPLWLVWDTESTESWVRALLLPGLTVDETGVARREEVSRMKAGVCHLQEWLHMWQRAHELQVAPECTEWMEPVGAVPALPSQTCCSLYGTAWDCMELHGTAWDCIGLHGTAQHPSVFVRNSELFTVLSLIQRYQWKEQKGTCSQLMKNYNEYIDQCYVIKGSVN